MFPGKQNVQSTFIVVLAYDTHTQWFGRHFIITMTSHMGKKALEINKRLFPVVSRKSWTVRFRFTSKQVLYKTASTIKRQKNEKKTNDFSRQIIIRLIKYFKALIVQNRNSEPAKSVRYVSLLIWPQLDNFVRAKKIFYSLANIADTIKCRTACRSNLLENNKCNTIQLRFRASFMLIWFMRYAIMKP